MKQLAAHEGLHVYVPGYLSMLVIQAQNLRTTVTVFIIFAAIFV